MCVIERDFVVPSLYGIIYSQNSNKEKWCLLKLTRKINSGERTRNVVKEANSGSEDEILAYL